MRTLAVPRRVRSLAGAGIVALAVVAVGCGDDTPQATRDRERAISQAEEFPPGRAAATEAKRVGAIPIDVRAPEEYATGHVAEATNLNVEDATFADDLAALDRSATYVVYCRSGRRSAIAAAEMRDAGITVLDGGALDDMVAAGWPTSTS